MVYAFVSDSISDSKEKTYPDPYWQGPDVQFNICTRIQSEYGLGSDQIYLDLFATIVRYTYAHAYTHTMHRASKVLNFSNLIHHLIDKQLDGKNLIT